MVALNDLDKKLLQHFRGYVVKKDLVRSVKVGANVPVFVLEYLIANSCSTDDEQKIADGMENVKKVLSEHYVNPEESTLVHSKIREKGRYKIIDKISVELDSKKDIYWAKLQNSNIKNGNIGDGLVQQHEKMLMGGIWAIIDVEYDPNIRIGQNIFPFVITEIKPIQLSTFDNSKITNLRKEFTKEEWLDVVLRSCGYEPNAEGIDHRMKMLLLSRLLPMVETNFNFIELGRGLPVSPSFLRSSHLMPYLFPEGRAQWPSYSSMAQRVKSEQSDSGTPSALMNRPIRSSRKGMRFH